VGAAGGPWVASIPAPVMAMVGASPGPVIVPRGVDTIVGDSAAVSPRFRPVVDALRPRPVGDAPAPRVG